MFALEASSGCQRAPAHTPQARAILAQVGTQTLSVDENLLPLVSRSEVEKWVADARMLNASGTVIDSAETESLESKRAMVRALLHQAVEPSVFSPAEVEQYFEQHRSRYDFLETRLVSHFCARPTDSSNEDAWGAARRYAEHALEESLIAPEVGESLETAASNVGGGRSFAGTFEQLPGFGRDGDVGDAILEAEFTAAAFALPIGTPSLVRSSIGYHVVIVREILPEQRATFSEVAVQVERHMRVEKAQERLAALLQRLQGARPTQANEQEIAAFARIELRTILGPSTTR